MTLPDLHRAIAEHKGTFSCERINKPQETKTVNFQHHIQPPAALDAPLPGVGQLAAFYATFGGVLLYHDADSGDAARYIAPPAEWPTLQEAFEGWTEHLSDEEREEILPDWIEHCQVIGETPHSGNYILIATDGECAGQVFEFDHDGFEFTHAAEDLVDYVQRLLHLDSPTLANIASHMRFIDKNTGAQWWILEMSDNQSHRVRTDV
ncbi:SMI1/KNR4 family protein [Acidovorax sp. ACV02]|uniref:SMI1/KNR4 family protein n=1 Tax=Acidovorax sp. ACV02 TaxID=2769310 RepID=UPI00177F8177|nr:SMI1/KNR4 family protein [Acidovorax sp. ACV02]MBD9406329.1 SMI1/KNR4 family protein [Acidovorax sp. ACV02]